MFGVASHVKRCFLSLASTKTLLTFLALVPTLHQSGPSLVDSALQAPRLISRTRPWLSGLRRRANVLGLQTSKFTAIPPTKHHLLQSRPGIAVAVHSPSARYQSIHRLCPRHVNKTLHSKLRPKIYSRMTRRTTTMSVMSNSFGQCPRYLASFL